MRIKINLINLLNASTSSERTFGFTDITYQSNFNDEYDSGITSLLFTKNLDHTYCDFIQDEVSDTFTDNDILLLSNDFIIIDGNLTADVITNISWLLNNEIIDLDVDGFTSIHTYTQNSENDVLEKDLSIYSIIQGQFNHSISVKNINIDIVQSELIAFNYVWIPSLNRYYYVDSVDIISADVKRIHLKEDVLMSWATLIREQSAFVIRKQNGSNLDALKDDRLPLEDKLSFTYYTSITNGSLKNVTLNYDLTSEYNFMVTSITSVIVNQCNDVNPPTDSDLPVISSHLTEHDCVRFADKNTIAKLLVACYNDDTSASFINSVLWLPFNPITIFDAQTSSSTAIFAGEKYLNNGSQFVQLNSQDAPASCYYTWVGTSPYLVIADFVFGTSTGIVITDSMLMRESYWEIFIPFVGWVNVDYSKIYGHRILIYYSLDFKTGISTAYIYDYTSKIVIYSTTCTLGIHIDVSTTNRLENTRQKQANDLNMLMSTLTSVMSIGVGVVSENPVAMAGGLLSLGKGVAGYVNANNQIYERANTSFGTSDGAVHSPSEVCIRRSYHAPITIDSDVYAHIQGYPANTYEDLDSVSGYTEVGEIHFNPMNEIIYQDEITEIVTLLKDGVIF